MTVIQVRGEAIERFVQLVREYRGLIDEARPDLRREFLSRCSILLPGIYADGLSLPDLGLEDEDVEREVASPLANLTTVLGSHDHYQMVFDPTDDFEVVTGSIADDLADIYIDLVAPLMTYEAGHVAAAVWQWKFNVEGHCGQHIVNVLAPIHRLLENPPALGGAEGFTKIK